MFPAISRRAVMRYEGQSLDIIPRLGIDRFFLRDLVPVLEERFAETIGVKHALAVSSGRISLEVILQALAIEPGKEVILPAYTYHSVPDAIRHVGLVPVFVDVDPRDNNLDPDLVQQKISDRTAAVLATHIFGHPCRLDRIAAICKKQGILLLEDCAHCIGARFAGQTAGTFGKAGFFSFGATKVFNTYGGGMIVTDDDALAKSMRKVLATHQPPDRAGLFKTVIMFSALHFLTQPVPFSFTLFPLLYLTEVIGLDIIGLYSRIFKRTAESISVPVAYSDLQAALALRQLETIEAQNAIRRGNAETLLALLDPEIPRLTPHDRAESAWYFFVLGIENREQVAKALLKSGLDTGYYIMDDCAALAGDDGDYPVTQWWREHSLQVPIHPPLRSDQMKQMAALINRHWR